MASQPYGQLLFLRWSLFNAVALGFLYLAWEGGLVQLFWDRDSSFIVRTIAGVAAFSWLWTGFRAKQLASELDEVRRGYTPLGLFGPADAVKLKLANRLALPRELANSLVLLGLIGTVWGFSVALAGVSAEAAQDVSQVGPMISNLLHGMNIAMDTTLVGSVFYLWIKLNLRLLEGGTVKLATAVRELQDGWSAPHV